MVNQPTDTSKPTSADTFESACVIHPELRGKVQMDALNTTLMRAQAVLAFIMTDAYGSEGFTLRRDIVVNGLWALEGMLDQMQLLIDVSVRGEAAK